MAQEQPGAARNSQEQPGQEKPDSQQASEATGQEQPGSRNTEESTTQPPLETSPAGGAPKQSKKGNSLCDIWRKSHPRSGLKGILDENGCPMSADESSSCLLQHWAGVFAATTTQPDAIREVILAGVPQLVVTNWELTQEQFFELLDKRPSSAPGPDGNLFGAIRQGGKNLYKEIYNAYLLWMCIQDIT